MIDIHCHLLYGVDDGANSKEESARMLKKAKEQGVDVIFLTPHLRHGMFPYRKEDVDKNFASLKELASMLGVEIFLGTEYHVNSEIVENFKSGRCHTLGGSRYILTEYSHASEFDYMMKMTREVVSAGYIPIIVHVERYECLTEDINLIYDLSEAGALIQNNADAVLGIEGRRVKKFCKKLLKEGLTDIIASDSHGVENRACNLGKCYEYIVKKYGKDYADNLFINNPAKIYEKCKH